MTRQQIGKMYLALGAAVLLTLAGCGKKAPETASGSSQAEGTPVSEAAENATPAAGSAAAESAAAAETTAAAAGSAAAAETKPGTAEETKEEAADGQAYGPVPGDLPASIEGSYRSGRVVVMAGASYVSQPEGIYRLTPGMEPELIAECAMSPQTSLCTDGWRLYYCDKDGAVFMLDLEENVPKPVKISAEDTLFGADSGVVGVNHYYAYIESGSIVDDMYSEDAGDLPGVTALSLSTGKPEKTWPASYGGCDGGLTYIAGSSYDVSPHDLEIIDFQGETQARISNVWTEGSSQGRLWYSLSEGGDEGSAVLYMIDGDETKEVLRFTEKGATFMGISVDGFLAQALYLTPENRDGYSDMVTICTDLRTGRELDQKYQKYAEENMISWNGAYRVGDSEFLTASDRICRMEKDGPVDVFDFPADLYLNGVFLTEDRILLADMENRVLIMDADGISGTHTIPVTLFSNNELVETDKARVQVVWPQFMTEGAYHYGGLSQALMSYSDDAEKRARALAQECRELAETLAGDGLYNKEKDLPMAAVVDAYVQRADTAAVSFMEHEYTDTIVGPKNYEVKTGYNYATGDGHALRLDEVVTDLNALAELMIAHIKENFPAQLSNLSPEDYTDELLSRRSLVSTRELSWVLGYEGVSFYFNSSVNFPFTRGSWKFYVSFSEHPELFDPKWFEVPDRYAYEVMAGSAFSEDYQTEGENGIQTVLLTAENARNQEGYPLPSVSAVHGWVSEGPIGTARGDSDTVVPIVSDTLRGVIIHDNASGSKAGAPRSGGRNWLILQTNGDSMSLVTFSLNGKFRQIGEYPRSALARFCNPNGEHISGPYVVHSLLSDPDLFTVLTPDKQNPEWGPCIRKFSHFEEGWIEVR